MGIRKTILLGFLLLGLSAFVIVVNSFSRSGFLLSELCNQSGYSLQLSSVQKEIECYSSEPIYSSVVFDFAIAAFIVGVVILLPCVINKNLTKRKGFVVLIFIAGSVLFFWIFDQAMQNLFRSLRIEGFQDAAWTVVNSSNFVKDGKDLLNRPTSFIIDIAAVFVFSFVTGLGTFFAGLVLGRSGKNSGKVASGIGFVILSILLEIAVCVLSIPVIFWLGFSQL